MHSVEIPRFRMLSGKVRFSIHPGSTRPSRPPPSPRRSRCDLSSLKTPAPPTPTVFGQTTPSVAGVSSIASPPAWARTHDRELGRPVLAPARSCAGHRDEWRAPSDRASRKRAESTRVPDSRSRGSAGNPVTRSACQVRTSTGLLNITRCLHSGADLRDRGATDRASVPTFPSARGIAI